MYGNCYESDKHGIWIFFYSLTWTNPSHYPINLTCLTAILNWSLCWKKREKKQTLPEKSKELRDRNIYIMKKSVRLKNIKWAVVALPFFLDNVEYSVDEPGSRWSPVECFWAAASEGTVIFGTTHGNFSILSILYLISLISRSCSSPRRLKFTTHCPQADADM